MKKLIEQFAKFGVVGVIAFFIDFGVMVFLTEVFGINPIVSAAISFVVSVTFNYFASMRYVFTHKEGMSRRAEFAIFVVLSVIGLGINELVMWFGVDILVWNYMFVKICATAIVMFWNFFSRKKWLDAGDDPQAADHGPSDAQHSAAAKSVKRSVAEKTS
jgi:putative flippase GtrA